jgi:nucleotide-binding universal stress UspA family protein
MFELRRILVPTDFSRHADEALEYAMYLGGQFHPEIALLHVDEFPVSPLGAGEVRDDVVLQYQRRKAAFLDEQFDRIQRGMQGKPVHLIPQVLSGRAYKVIIEESEEREYDLIVMATRGLTHLSSYLIGSTAERVVRLSRQPVLTIQQGPVVGARAESVLCPTDLSPAGNAALSYALSIARQFKAVLYVQYISELEKPEAREQVLARMPDLKEFHPQADEVQVEVVVDRDVEPSNSIVRFADDREISIIVMSTHGRKGLRRVYIGNNTAEVVRKARQPVLTVSHPFHKRVFAHPLTEKRLPPKGVTG